MADVLDPENDYVVSVGIDGKSITITPTGKVLDNSIYTVTVSHAAYQSSGEGLPVVSAEFRTPYSPLYCSLDSLKLVVDSFGIPDENMLSYIRQASKEADFIAGGTAVKSGQAVPFAVEQFVRTKSTYDCLSRGYMERAYSGAGSEYTLDVATFKDSMNAGVFKDLLDRLGKELQKWQDAIRGYYNEGRVKPKATRIGIKSSQNSDVSWTTFDSIIQDATRNMPQWS
jgi:hypothetical protein